MSAKLLGDCLHLPRRDALNVHLHQRRHERLLAALVALEHFRTELPTSFLRNTKFHLPNAGDEIATVVARSVPPPRAHAFVLFSAKMLRHFRFQHVLKECL